MRDKSSLVDPKSAERMLGEAQGEISLSGASNFSVLCDFDGTITSFDTAEYVLRLFADGDWEVFDAMLERGEITLEECMVRQFELVHIPEDEIITAIDAKVELRPHFAEMVRSCRARGMEVYVVSAGLKFLIEHCLLRMNLMKDVKLHCGTSHFDGNRIAFEFPSKSNPDAKNFKDDLVVSCRKRGGKVAYIGDGLSDIDAARRADLRFAVTNLKLERTLKQEGLTYHPFLDFSEVAAILNLVQ